MFESTFKGALMGALKGEGKGGALIGFDSHHRHKHLQIVILQNKRR